MNTKEYHKNPRKISEKSMSDLALWMQELGDLGGVVHDLNSNEIISGNQRSKVIDLNNAEFELVKDFDTPTPQGTVKLGYIIYEGERFSYRAVRWTPEQCEKANIIANKAGGVWDMKILTSDFDKSKLLDFGFDFKDFDTPTPQGTVKLGYIIYEGERFSYRAVRWTPEQCEKANIIANKAGGVWDMKILTSDFDKSKLLDFGFDFKDFDTPETRDKSAKAEHERMELKMNEHHDYIVLLFNDKNDFISACNTFGVKKVIYSTSEKRSDVGIGRVIDGKKALDNVAKNNYQQE